MSFFARITFTLFLVATFSTAAFSDDKTKDTFVVVTSESAETQGMAMVLSLQAIQNGSNVRILLCDAGGDMALKAYKGTALKPKNVTPQQLLQKAMSQGAKAEVCALYMPNRGLSEADLIDGVTGVKPPVIGAYMANPNVRYFTF